MLDAPEDVTDVQGGEMTVMEMSFNDYMHITECIKILKEYKEGDFNERECLIRIGKHYQELAK